MRWASTPHKGSHLLFHGCEKVWKRWRRHPLLLQVTQQVRQHTPGVLASMWILRFFFFCFFFWHGSGVGVAPAAAARTWAPHISGDGIGACLRSLTGLGPPQPSCQRILFTSLIRSTNSSNFFFLCPTCELYRVVWTRHIWLKKFSHQCLWRVLMYFWTLWCFEVFLQSLALEEA